MLVEEIGLYELGPGGECEGVYTGDIVDLAAGLPDDSIDLILTDPPYPKEYLWTYEALARLGARVLKPGGWLFAYAATEHLPTVIDYMKDWGLDYFWVFVLYHSHGEPRMWGKKLFSSYKPVMAYTKGPPRLNPWMPTLWTDRKDKRYHKWGQGTGFPTRIINMLTEPGGIVLDPFCGGGNAIAAAIRTHRHYLAFEIDPMTAEQARERARKAPPPLPEPLPIEQLGLI